MTRIAYIVDEIIGTTAGTEQQLLMLLTHLDRSQFEPTLVCLRNTPWLRSQSLPFRVEVLELGSMLRPGFAAACRRFARLHRRHQFDIVQTFTIDANYFGTFAARIAGIQRIVSSRRDMGYWQTRRLRFLLRAVRPWTPYYLANSHAAAQACVENEGVDPNRITVIHNGLDLKRFENPSSDSRERQRQAWKVQPDEVLVGIVANLRPVKNIGTLVAAAKALDSERTKWKFVVVGEGPSRENLEAAIRRAGLSDRFMLPGAHADVVPCLAAFDIAVLCSESESFSNALIEYMAAGLPIVASRVGGASEVIRSGETGILYDPAEPRALEEALHALHEDRTRADRMARKAREDAFSRFNREVCVKKHEDFYRTRVLGATSAEASVETAELRGILPSR